MNTRFVRIRRLLSSLAISAVVVPVLAWAQHEGHTAPPEISNNVFLNFGEVVTGLAAALVAFQAALAYREGRLGKGMTWVAVGMTIMAVGHFILVIKRFLGVDPLGFLGTTGSFVAFTFAVFGSFITSALGFWMIRRAAQA